MLPLIYSGRKLFSSVIIQRNIILKKALNKRFINVKKEIDLFSTKLQICKNIYHERIKSDKILLLTAEDNFMKDVLPCLSVYE